jgi:hypothetical protein
MQHTVPAVLPQHSDHVEEELQRINLALHDVFSPHLSGSSDLPLLGYFYILATEGLRFG